MNLESCTYMLSSTAEWALRTIFQNYLSLKGRKRLRERGGIPHSYSTVELLELWYAGCGTLMWCQDSETQDLMHGRYRLSRVAGGLSNLLFSHYCSGMSFSNRERKGHGHTHATSLSLTVLKFSPVVCVCRGVESGSYDPNFFYDFITVYSTVVVILLNFFTFLW